jgi:hypothetical protein
MNEDLPLSAKELLEQVNLPDTGLPKSIEALEARPAIDSSNGAVRITLTTAEHPVIVMLPMQAFQEMLRAGEKAFREKGLSDKFISKGRQFNSFTKP